VASRSASAIRRRARSPPRASPSSFPISRPTGVANEHNAPGDLDPNWGGIDSLVEEITKAGGAASATIGDVSREADAGRMVEEVLSRYGRLEHPSQQCLARRRVRTATRSRTCRSPPGILTMGVNAKGAFLMARAALVRIYVCLYRSVRDSACLSERIGRRA